jgi:outer membrane protein insertion porin family
VPTDGRYQRLNLDWGIAGDARYLRLNASPAVHPADRASRSASTPSRLGQGPGGKPYPIFKNFYGGGLGTVRGFDQGSLGPIDVTGAYIGGNRAQHQQRAVPAGPGHRQRPHAALVRLSRRRQRLGRERASSPRQPARVGRSRPELDLAGGPAEAQLRHADPQAAGDRIQRLQFQIGTAF